MSDPSLALQKGVRDALVAASVCSGRVYDRVPSDPTYPYCVVPDASLADDGNTCWQQDEVFQQISVFSRAVGHVEVKQQAALVRAALDTEITITGFQTALGEWQSTRYPQQPDALSTQAVLIFRYLIQHPAA
jgi:hypothetical protein